MDPQIDLTSVQMRSKRLSERSQSGVEQHAENLIDFSLDLGCLLEGKIREKLDFVAAFFDVVVSCVFGSIFHCFSKAGNLKNVALA